MSSHPSLPNSTFPGTLQRPRIKPFWDPGLTVAQGVDPGSSCQYIGIVQNKPGTKNKVLSSSIDTPTPNPTTPYPSFALTRINCHNWNVESAEKHTSLIFDEQICADYNVSTANQTQ